MRDLKGCVGLLALVAITTIGLIVVSVVAIRQLTKPNFRMYFKQPIVATGVISGSSARFIDLQIGSSQTAYSGEPRFQLQFQDGSILAFPDPDFSVIEMLADSVGESAEFPLPDVRQYALPSCRVVCSSEAVLQVLIYSHARGDWQVTIKTDAVEDWMEFPLSDAELVALFGPADRVVDEFRH